MAISAKTVSVLGVGLCDRSAAAEIVEALDGGGTLTDTPLTTVGLGAKNGATVTAVENVGLVHKTVLTLASTPIATVDAGAAGAHGGVKVYDFPEGNILVLGAVTDLSTLAGAGGVADTAAVVGSLGSTLVATDNATLTSTEANVVPSTSGTLVAGAGSIDGVSTGVVVLDGTATPADLYLNLAMPDAGSSADDSIAVSGTITITWVNLGDK